MSELRGRQAVIADLVTGLFFAVLGVAVVVAAARMPTLAERGANPLTAPGIFPALIGMCFLFCGTALALRSRRRLRDGGFEPPADASPISPRVLAGFAMMLVTVAMVGRIDVRLAIAVFALAFCALFVNWRRERLGRQAVAVAAVTVVAALLIPMAFEDLFLVRMP